MRDLLHRDRRLFVLLHARLRRPWLDPIMIGCTRAGTKGAIWLVIAAVLAAGFGARGRFAAILSIGAMLLAEGLINLVLKPLARRERPYTHQGLTRLLVPEPGAHSWPSAHAGSSMAAATVLAVSYPWWGLLFLVLATLIAYSRVYVGVHYPLDVVTGMVLGVACAGAALAIAVLAHPPLHLSMVTQFGVTP